MTTPVGTIPVWAIVVANVAFWAVVQAGTGYLVHRLPRRRLAADGWLFAPRTFERSGRWYERLHIRRWKDRLPEVGALFSGGMSKKQVPARSRDGLERYAVETRRAELGHWLAVVPGPIAALWNPPVGAALMVAYGVLVNLPFIAIQRYNRLRIQRILAARRHLT